MIHRHFGKTILLGCMLLACAGFANADIGQCNKNGKPVYKNVRCNKVVKIEHASEKTHTRSLARASSPKPKAVASSTLRKPAWTRKATSDRRFPLDVATAKAARTSMLLIEANWSYLREQKLAALE